MLEEIYELKYLLLCVFISSDIFEPNINLLVFTVYGDFRLLHISHHVTTTTEPIIAAGGAFLTCTFSSCSTHATRLDPSVDLVSC